MSANNRLEKLVSADFSHTYGLSEPIIMAFVRSHGQRLAGLMLNGKGKLDEHFWLSVIPLLPNIRLVDTVHSTQYMVDST